MGKINKIIELDYIRAISCILVILYHYTTRYCESVSDLKYPFSVPFGHMAVCSFFVLSGFLSLYTSKPDIELIPYFKKRFVRLYPVFWVAMIITTVVCFFLLPSFVVSVKDFILNLTMIPELFKVKSVDGAYWTLLRELVFYIYIGIILKLQSWLKSKDISNIINYIYISTVWLIVLFAMYFVNLKNDNIIVTLLNYATIYNYAQQFIAGMMIYALLKAENKKQVIIPIINLLLCFACNLLTRGLGYTVFFVIVVCVVLFVVLNLRFKFYSLGKKTVEICKPLSFVAVISYPVYLIHQNVGYAVISTFEKLGITTELVIIIPIAIAFLLGWLLHKFVEIPSSKLLRKILFKG